MLQSEVLDRHWFTSLAEAESALPSFADYDNFHRLSASRSQILRGDSNAYLRTQFLNHSDHHAAVGEVS